MLLLSAGGEIPTLLELMVGYGRTVSRSIGCGMVGVPQQSTAIGLLPLS